MSLTQRAASLTLPVFVAMLAVTAACGAGTTANRIAATAEESPVALTPAQKTTAAKLRTYCRACHGVGTLRFIHDDSDTRLWTFIQTNAVPGSNVLWIDALANVLAWPSDAPPPFDQLRSPGKDWMPKGAKRLQLAEERTGNETTRRLMLRTLREARATQ